MHFTFYVSLFTLAARSPIFQLKLRLRREKIKPITFLVDPMIRTLRASVFEPGCVGRAHIEDDL